MLLDAIAATAVLAIAGGAALVAMTALLNNQQEILDRSVETTNIDSFVQTLVLDWREMENRTWSDGLFQYQAAQVSSPDAAKGLVRVRVQALDSQDRITSDFEIWVPG